MGSMANTIEIMWGLPGSGKTTYVKERIQNIADTYKANHEHLILNVFSPDYEVTNYNTYEYELSNGYCFQDCEYTTRKRRFEHSIDDRCSIISRNGGLGNTSFTRNATHYYIIDTICTTHQYFSDLLEMAHQIIYYVDTLKVVVWEEDRDTCTLNDLGRSERYRSSKYSIKNLSYERPTVDSLVRAIKETLDMDVVPKDTPVVDKKSIHIEVEYRTVECREDWKVLGAMAQEHKPSEWHYEPCVEDGILREECDDDSRYIFNKLWDLLEVAVPDLKLTDYRQIHNTLVHCVSEFVPDYYSDGYTVHRYEISLDELYNFLCEHGYIKV